MRPEEYSKRQFVRTFAFGTASTLIGTPWIGSLLLTFAGEQRAQAASDGRIILQLNQFPALLNEYGSIRVSITPIEGSYPVGQFFPLIISRATGNTFYAVNSSCTHRGCIVNVFDGNSIGCPCHGSEFAIDGTVTNGPANEDLQRYSVEFDAVNTLTITVPGLGYSITATKLENGTSSRIGLQFPTIDQAQYQLHFRPTTTAAWTIVPFATSTTGAANNWFVAGDGLPKTIFADRTTPTGFFCISLLVKEV